MSVVVGAAVWVMTAKTLMPGTLVGDGAGRYGTLMEVESPGGKLYTPNPDNVYDFETGAIMLMHRRAEQMAAQGYQVKVRLDNASFRVFQPKKHGQHGGYVITRTSEFMTCSCKSCERHRICKHIMAVCSLLHKSAKQMADANKLAVATRYANLAASLLAASDKPAPAPEVSATPEPAVVVVVAIETSAPTGTPKRMTFEERCAARGLRIDLDF